MNELRKLHKSKNKQENYFKLINYMAFPILMNYVVSTIFEVLDKAIVGRYSTVGFAAVGIASKIIFAITGTLGIISVGYNILAAKIKAENDEKEFEKLFNVVMTVCLVIGIVFFIGAILFGNLLFSKLYSLGGEILKLTDEYFYIASFTVLQNLVIFIFSAYFRNQNYTQITFYATLVSTIVNIFFDICFVYGRLGFPELGVMGAAIGSAIGLMVNIIIYAFTAIKKYRLHFQIIQDIKWIKKLIKLYIPLLFQDLIEESLFTMCLVAIISRMSLENIAAYNLLETVGSVILLPTFAFAQAGMTLTLQHPDKDSSKKLLLTAFSESLLFVIVLGIAVYVKPMLCFGFITEDVNVINNAKTIFISVIAVQLANSAMQVFKYYLQGNDNEKFVLAVTSVVSLVSLVWIYLLARYMSINGLYIGLLISYALCDTIYLIKTINYIKHK